MDRGIGDNTSNIGNDVVVEAIIRQFQPTILSALQNNGIVQQLFANANFADSDAYESLLQLIIQRLRALILEFIRIYRANQVVITTPRPTTTARPVPSGNAITNIFGTGGANSVQVETPNYNYEYNHGRSVQ